PPGLVGSTVSRARRAPLARETLPSLRVALPVPGANSSAQNFAAIFQATAEARQDTVALRTRHDETRMTWGDYGRRVREIAAGLAALGVEHGSTVAVMMTNRPEFHPVDTAAVHLGAVPWSIYNTLPAEQVAYEIRDAGSKVLVAEQAMLGVVREAAAGAGV